MDTCLQTEGVYLIGGGSHLFTNPIYSINVEFTGKISDIVHAVSYPEYVRNCLDLYLLKFNLRTAHIYTNLKEHNTN